MALQLGLDLTREIFTTSQIFGVNWLLSVILTVIALVLIAGKNWNDYKSLLLPVTVGLHIIGITPNLLQYVLGVILLLLDTLSLQMLGSIAETTRGLATQAGTGIKTGIQKIKSSDEGFKTIQEYQTAKETLEGLKLGNLKKQVTKTFIKDKNLNQEMINKARTTSLAKLIKEKEEEMKKKLKK